MPAPQTTQETGADARAMDEQALAAAREEAVRAERQRVSEIQVLSATATKYGVDAAVISEFIAKGVSVDQARKDLFNRLADQGGQECLLVRRSRARSSIRGGTAAFWPAMAWSSASPACRWRCCSAPTAGSS